MELTKYRLLGKSGLRVYPLALGTQFWGISSNERVSRAIFEEYLSRGGNFVDTADIYNQGIAEQFLGKFMKGKRERLVVSTKYTMNDSPGNPNAGGNHRKNMFSSLENSLKRLRTDHIDLFWVHAWDFRASVEEVLKGLDDLSRQGKILHFGICNAPAWKIAEADTTAMVRGWPSVAAVQIQYNLLERSAEFDMVPMACEHNIALLPWSPLAGGLLAKGAEIATDTKSLSKYPLLSSRAIMIAKKISCLANDLGKTASQVALNWLLQKPAVTAPLIGASTIGQLEQNLGCLDFNLEKDDVAFIDNISEPEEAEKSNPDMSASKNFDIMSCFLHMFLPGVCDLFFSSNLEVFLSGAL